MLSIRSFSIIPVVLLSAGCSGQGSYFRNSAESNLEYVRIIQADIFLPEEFRSVEDTIRKADRLDRTGRFEESEKYYRLAYAKTELMKKCLGETDKNRAEQKCTENQREVSANEAAAKPSGIGQTSLAPSERGKESRVAMEEPVMSPSGGSSEVCPPDGPPQGEGFRSVPETPEALHRSGSGTAKGVKTPPDKEDAGPERNVRTEALPQSSDIIGRKTVYRVKPGETLQKISAKTGVSWRAIARENGLDPKKPLEPGTVLSINKLKIVPRRINSGIIINIPDRTLYFFRDDTLKQAYPVGLGMGKVSDLYAWQTPTGRFTIRSKVKDPTWYMPYSIQQKMKEDGKEFETIVPPGPKNPLGKYAINTTIGGVLIHSTTNPGSIGRFKSHGCIRMLPKDMEKFFNTIKVKTSGEIIYEPVKAAVSDDGHVYLEVHSDRYKRIKDLEAETRRVLKEKNALDLVDWKKVRELLKSGIGMVEDVTSSMAVTTEKTASKAMSNQLQ